MCRRAYTDWLELDIRARELRAEYFEALGKSTNPEAGYFLSDVRGQWVDVEERAFVAFQALVSATTGDNNGQT